MKYEFIFRYSFLGKVLYYEVLRHNTRNDTYIYWHNSEFFCHAVNAYKRGVK